MFLVLATAIVLAASPGAVPQIHATPPVSLAPARADSIRKAAEADWAETAKWLKSAPTSYLATVQRRDFEDRTSLVVGRDAASDVRIDDPELAARHLRVTVVGDSFHVQALDDSAHFRVKDVSLREATLGPSSIGVGRFMLRLSHQRYPAIIVFDPRSPRYALYHGNKVFPVDLRYRYELPLTANPNPDTLIIMSTRGNQRRAVRVGWFDFLAGRTPCRLEAVRLLEPGVGENDVSIFFRDATSGRESYSVGRYVDPQRLPNGRWLVDFNNAYNPACAFSDHYNCPIPPKANTLKVAIRAGEMDSHYH